MRPAVVHGTPKLTSVCCGVCWRLVFAQPLEEYPQSAGEETLLVTGVQARNNARALFAGSLFMFSDAALAAIAATPADSHKNDGGVPSANAKFTAGVLDWVFQRSGVIRITHVQHSRADGTPPDRQLQNKEAHNDVAASMFPEPEVAPATQLYRVGDNVTYRVDVEVRVNCACVFSAVVDVLGS